MALSTATARDPERHHLSQDGGRAELSGARAETPEADAVDCGLNLEMRADSYGGRARVELDRAFWL